MTAASTSTPQAPPTLKRRRQARMSRELTIAFDVCRLNFFTSFFIPSAVNLRDFVLGGYKRSSVSACIAAVMTAAHANPKETSLARQHSFHHCRWRHLITHSQHVHDSLQSLRVGIASKSFRQRSYKHSITCFFSVLNCSLFPRNSSHLFSTEFENFREIHF